MRELTAEEIEQVGGGFGVVGGGLGAAGGAAAYVVTTLADGGQINPGALMMATVLGGVSGFTGGLAGAAWGAGMRGAAALSGGASVTSGVGSAMVGPITNGSMEGGTLSPQGGGSD